MGNCLKRNNKKECSVYYEVLINKVLLECGHEFCCKCCTKITNNNRKFVYPLCRKDYKQFGAEENVEEEKKNVIPEESDASRCVRLYMAFKNCTLRNHGELKFFMTKRSKWYLEKSRRRQSINSNQREILKYEIELRNLVDLFI